MPKAFIEAFTPEQVDIIAHTHAYGGFFEEYIFLNLKGVSVAMSLNHPSADEEILRHYREKGIREYTSYVSDVILPGYKLPLRITRVAFTSQSDAAEKLMAEDVKKDLQDKALQRDSVQYKFIEKSDKVENLVFAWRNVSKRNLPFRLAQLCTRHNFHIDSFHFAYVDALTTKSVLLGSLDISGEHIKDEHNRLGFMREFELLKHFRGEDAITPLVSNKTITGNQANLLRAFASLTEQILTHVNPSMYTEEAALEAYAFHPELTVKVVDLFRAKFHPKKNNQATYEKVKEELEKALKELDTGKKKHDDRRRMIFGQALNFINHILKTNVYEYHKLGMGFRLCPQFMENIPGWDRKSVFPELPYGIFYIKSWDYIGFHVRFRNLARGGLRTVVSRDAEHLKYERANAFHECYNLAYTQQAKNKDIPEGGSKALLFLLPFDDLPAERETTKKELEASGIAEADIKSALDKYTKEQSLEYMYFNQRCFINTFLTLFIWNDEANKLKYGNLVDYHKTKEIIYIGPDENLHDCLIDWIAHESKRLEYFPVKGAFISGKDGAGMNHKEFGVTSLGILQFVKVAAQHLGILDKPFTVKITGGPDGDVAGNMMVLLGKHLPNTKLLTITDGFGACYDPEGMDYAKLTEMFHKVQAINKYPAELLHNGGWLLCLWETRQPTPFTKETLCYFKRDGKVVEEWIPSNKAMHMFSSNAHSHYADIFVPGGGRPRTLTAQNVQDMFVDGKPTCKAIVEGANLYLTQEAREVLEDAGVLLYKDSSANKCGVVSSSYEILAGLVLDDETYISVKKELATNVLARLEKIAWDEAQEMLRYWLEHGKKIRMSSVSKLVSDLINKYTDQIVTYLKDVDLYAPENKHFLDVYVNYVPETLKKHNLEAVHKVVPDHHKKCIIATTIACKLVYGKGLDWEPSVVDILPIITKQ
jgi:glutamate dehydrogenase